MVSVAVAAKKKPGVKRAPAPTSSQYATYATFTDPGKAGPDYLVQGEYEGTVEAVKLGAQVVARGAGKFNVYFLPGGLPGAGWDGMTRIRTGAKTMKSATGARVEVVPAAGWTGHLQGGNLQGQTPEGKPFLLQKVERRSPTLGEKPPAGAVVLFDGKSVDEWLRLPFPGAGVRPIWAPGHLLNNGVGTRRRFGDFKLHLEFRLPFMPGAMGQMRGNSGVFLQDRYEIQLVDSFGSRGTEEECGAIVFKVAPRLNMCFPPLSWQTYDIDFIAARFDEKGRKTADAVVTVWHNGEPIHDEVKMKGTTLASALKEGPAPGPIHLQYHGNPVVFRNVWLVQKPV